MRQGHKMGLRELFSVCVATVKSWPRPSKETPIAAMLAFGSLAFFQESMLGLYRSALAIPLPVSMIGVTFATALTVGFLALAGHVGAGELAGRK